MPSPIQRREGPRGVSWTVQVRVGRKPNGKPAYKVKTFKLEREAKAYLTAVRTEVDAGTVVLPSKKTLREYVAEWLETAEKGQHAKANTLATYRSFLEVYILPELGDRLLQGLRPAALERLYAELRGRGIAASTIRGAHGALKAGLRRAVRLGLLSSDPTLGAKLPQGDGREMLYLEPEQAASLLTAAAGDYFFPVLAIALATGARPSEYLGLTWPDIDLDGHRLHIRRTLVRVAKRGQAVEQIHTATTKTKGSRRELAITDREVAILRTWKARQGEHRLRAGAMWQDDGTGYTFTDEVGRPLSAQKVGNRLRRLLRQAGLPVVRLYDLRHTNATALFKAGTHPKLVQERLGHSSIRETFDTYSHVIPSMGGDVAETLGSLFLGWMQTGCETGRKP